MQIMNWTEIEPSGNGTAKLDAGAYVLRIIDVTEHTSRKGDPYLTFVYDVAEGVSANHFANETRDYTHSFNRSYTGNAAGFFRAFLDALVASNNGRFDLEAWNRKNLETETYHWGDFRGLVIGALFRDRMYTNNKGRDVTVLDLVRAMPAQDVREGNWTVPPVKDDRDNQGYSTTASTQSTAPAASLYDSDLPF